VAPPALAMAARPQPERHGEPHRSAEAADIARKLSVPRWP